jgi:uncharacterized protein (TIGR03437 family)
VVAPTFFGPLPYLVANDKVTVNNIPAPIFNVANVNGQQQITFQVPCETTAGTSIPVTVNTAGGGSASTTITLQAASPGLFTNIDSDGTARVVAVKPDGTFVRAQTAADPAGNPALRGQIIRVYATGLGPVSPTVATNAFAPLGVDATVTGTVVGGITNQAQQGEGVRVVSARLLPGEIGVYEVQVQIPNDAQTGNDVLFSVAVIPAGSGTPLYSQGVKLAVQ